MTNAMMWTAAISFLSFSGEFTLRAFLNGRVDLSQAENIEKLISARSVAAADAALAGLQVTPFFRKRFSEVFFFSFP